MSQHKYACPYCGQHIEYTDAHVACVSPVQSASIPSSCPRLLGGEMTSSLRLAQPIGQARRPDFISLSPACSWHCANSSIGKLLAYAWYPLSWWPAPWWRHRCPPATQRPRRQRPAEAGRGPRALDTLTELTRANQLVQDRLAAVNRAFAACQAAEKKQAEMHDLHAVPPARRPCKPRT